MLSQLSASVEDPIRLDTLPLAKSYMQVAGSLRRASSLHLAQLILPSIDF